MTNKIPVVWLDPNLENIWLKRKDEILTQFKISLEEGSQTLEGLLTKGKYNSYPCGCLGPRGNDILCPCSKYSCYDTFRFYIYNELTK